MWLRMARKRNPKKKLEIVFDAQKRKEFLTGFRKRKNERRKRAKAELEQRIKEERKRIRQEIKNGIQHLKKTFEPLRELTEEDKISEKENISNEKEYEDDAVKIKITELTTKEIAKQTFCLGENYLTDNEDRDDDDNVYDNDKQETLAKDPNSIPGMDYDIESKSKLLNNESPLNTAIHDKPLKHSNTKLLENSQFKSKKDLNHLMKTNTLKQMRKSKVFQMKRRFEQRANQKRARREKRNALKSLPKHLRIKKKLLTNRSHKERFNIKRKKGNT